MNKANKFGFTVLLSFFFTLIIFSFSEDKVKAGPVTLPTDYHFSFNGDRVDQGEEIVITAPESTMYVAADNLASDATIQWNSTELGVVSLEAVPLLGSNFIKMVRHGPGYSVISATITQGGSSHTISIVAKVALGINYASSGFVTATTSGDRILVLDDADPHKTIFLKYTDYTPEGQVVAVSGSAIGADYVTWESDNIGVATVSGGAITAVGAGNATITIRSNTMSSTDRPMEITAKIIVKPQFSITFQNSLDDTITYHSYDDYTDPLAVADGIPSSFVINSNASLGTNLKWEVYDCSTGKKIPEGESSKMDYSVSDISGNVSFGGVKAGTYEIYAFADPDYSKTTYAPYAYLKIIVPIDIGDIFVVMNVGDTYSLLDNSNITGVNIFGAPNYVIGTQNIAEFNPSNYVITAKSKGNVMIELTYNPALDLYDDDYEVPPVTILISVIDGISLSTTNAVLYTQGTLLLTALVTDPTEAITWTSSDPTIATVTDGLVRALKAGTATITASQKINGVVKKATCRITVQATVTNIVLNPSSTTLAIGAFATLHAVVTPSNMVNVNLQWKSSNNSVVTIVEANGLSATIQGVAGGIAVISAINQDNVVVGYCQVSVQQPVTSITLSETSAVVKLTSRTLQLRAAVYPDNALNKAVTWTSSNTSLATVDVNGVVRLLKPGTVTIIATSQDNPNVTAMCNLTIEVPVASVALDEPTKVMYVGQSARLTYVILPVNASNNLVTWTSINPSVVTVDATGKVTAKSVGTTIIMLKTAEGGFTVYCTITVKSVATAIKLDVSQLNLKTGETYAIKAALTPKDATDASVVWESSDPKVVIVDTEGKVTAKSSGTAIIMARTEAGAVAYVKVNVREPATGVMLNFSEKTIYVGQKFKIEASVSPSTASELSVTWKSSNEEVATISEEGEIEGLAGGVAVITCTTVDGGYMATCVITVRETVTTITLNYDNYNLGIDDTVTLIATVTTETATNQKVIWSSSDESIAAVNQKGKVTGIKTGYATITATATDGSDVEASCEVRVVNPVERITVDRTYVTMYVGDGTKINASVSPKNATLKTVIWTSSDTKIVIVDDEGNITALQAGSVTITASTQDSSGKKAICTVVVNDRIPSTGITVQDKKLTMVPGETTIVQTVINPTASTDKCSWSSDNPGVAKVDKKSGKITAVSTGTAFITVMTESGKTATVEVTVIGLNMTEITLEQYTTYPYPLTVEGYTGTVQWSVENPAICVVINGRVSSRAVGTTYVTATVNGRKLRCKVTVVPIS